MTRSRPEVIEKMSKKVPFSYKRAKPLDLTFENLTSLDTNTLRIITLDFVSSYRMLGVPPKVDGRYKTASLLLNNNRIAGSLDGIRAVIDKLFYQPDALCWLDVSYNQLTGISHELLTFPNLRTLYMHHNDLRDICAVESLSQISRLRSFTLSRNPVSAIPEYRTLIIYLLPQLTKLDFVTVTSDERFRLLPAAMHNTIVKLRKAKQSAVKNSVLYKIEHKT